MLGSNSQVGASTFRRRNTHTHTHTFHTHTQTHAYSTHTHTNANTYACTHTPWCLTQPSVGLVLPFRVDCCVRPPDLPAKCGCQLSSGGICSAGACTPMPFEFDGDFHIYGKYVLVRERFANCCQSCSVGCIACCMLSTAVCSRRICLVSLSFRRRCEHTGRFALERDYCRFLR